MLKLASNWEALLRLWQDEQGRQKVRAQLEQAGVHLEVLAEVLNVPDANPVGVLACVAFRQALSLTRAQRAEQFQERQAARLTLLLPKQRIELEALLKNTTWAG